MEQHIIGATGATGAGADADILRHPSMIFVSDPLEQYNATPFTPEPYTASKNIEDQHDFTRFGHTNNFESLIKGLTHNSDEATKDYIVGVCAAAMLIFGIALVWFMVIICLKIAGQKKVGFLAGRLVHPDYDARASSRMGTLPVIEEEPSTEEEIESLAESSLASPLIISDSILIDAEAAKRDKKFKRKTFAVRTVFVLSGLCVMVCSALFYAKGVALFNESLNSFSDGLDLIQQTATKTIQLTQSIVTDKDALKKDYDQTKTDVGGDLCPGDKPIANLIKDKVAELEQEIQVIESQVQESIKLFEDDLREVITITEDVNNSLEYANIFFYVAISISIIIGVLILAMLTVTFFSARGVTNCCTKFATYAIVWPLFVFFLILFWIFALLFLITSLSGSDFCVKPDQVVEGILYQYEDRFQSTIFQFILFWVSGCAILPTDFDLSEIGDGVTKLVETVHSLSTELMKTELSVLEDQCGLSSAAATSLRGGAGLLHNASHIINRAWIDTRSLLECKSFNPIYTKFVHDAICTDGVGGLTWLFTSSFFLAFFAMIMITFRAGFYPVKQNQARSSGTSLLSKSGL